MARAACQSRPHREFQRILGLCSCVTHVTAHVTYVCGGRTSRPDLPATELPQLHPAASPDSRAGRAPGLGLLDFLLCRVRRVPWGLL